ncbi:hypothetical protein FRC02_008486 [Tulasnella sp. 418]|nr:hypothetical protein FRC02_008486 [Tulasnella sp. 418]
MRAKKAAEQAAIGVPPPSPAATTTTKPATPVRQSTVPSVEKSHPYASQPTDVRIYINTSNTTINLDPSAGVTASSNAPGSPIKEPNPFSDAASVSTLSTNVIPIAYVPPSSASMSITDGIGQSGRQGAMSPLPPSRPARAPDLDLRLPPSAVDRASLAEGELKAPKTPYAHSTRSGVSGVSSRASTISSASSVLYENPTIVTNARVGKQVLGVVKAEVIAIPSASSPSTPSTARLVIPHSVARSRVSQKSPLGASSFFPEDIEMNSEPLPPLPNSPVPPQTSQTPESNNSSPSSVKSNPFTDKHRTSLITPSIKSTNTFGSPLVRYAASQPLPESRPDSVVSGVQSPTTPRTDTFANGRTITPTHHQPQESISTLPAQPEEAEQEQEEMFEPPHLPYNPRQSTTSVISSASKTDSLLAAFPFLPPTPGSMQSQFSPNVGGAPPSPRNPGGFPAPGHGHTPSMATVRTVMTNVDDPLPLPVMPAVGRRAQGYSTLSQVSNSSSGLDAFPFHFGNANGDGSDGLPDSATLPNGMILPPSPLPRSGLGERASLDTIALSRDLEAYPLAYDGSSVASGRTGHDQGRTMS